MDTPPINRPIPKLAPHTDASAPDTARRAALREKAVEFEAMFLAEMFKHAGAGKATPGFDGGHGESAFGSLLVNEQTRLMAERGGIGIAETVFQSLLQKESQK